MDKWKRRLEEVEEALQKLQNTLGGGWWKLHSKTKGKLLTQQQLFAIVVFFIRKRIFILGAICA